MALLADKSADVNSNLVSGNNTQSLTFTMPGGVAMKVLSVVATINNGAATAVTPELTIRDQSGVVIAARKQSSTIPAGDTGTATWALRLDDDSAASGGGTSGIFFDTDPQTGGFLTIETTGFDPVTGNGFDFNVAGGNDAVWHNPGGAAFIWETSSFTSEMLLRDNRWFATLSGGANIDLDQGLGPGFADLNMQLGSTQFDMTEATGVQRHKLATSGFFEVQDHTGDVLFSVDETGATLVKLQTGGTLIVTDSADNPVFQVDEDGDLHGLTGKSLTFDL